MAGVAGREPRSSGCGNNSSTVSVYRLGRRARSSTAQPLVAAAAVGRSSSPCRSPVAWPPRPRRRDADDRPGARRGQIATSGATPGHAAPVAVGTARRSRLVARRDLPVVTDGADGSYRWTTTLHAGAVDETGASWPTTVPPRGSRRQPGRHRRARGRRGLAGHRRRLRAPRPRTPGPVGDVVLSRRRPPSLVAARGRPRRARSAGGERRRRGRRRSVGRCRRTGHRWTQRARRSDAARRRHERDHDAYDPARRPGSTLSAACPGPAGTVVAIGTDANGATVVTTIDVEADAVTTVPAPLGSSITRVRGRRRPSCCFAGERALFASADAATFEPVAVLAPASAWARSARSGRVRRDRLDGDRQRLPPGRRRRPAAGTRPGAPARGRRRPGPDRRDPRRRRPRRARDGRRRTGVVADPARLIGAVSRLDGRLSPPPGRCWKAPGRRTSNRPAPHRRRQHLRSPRWSRTYRGRSDVVTSGDVATPTPAAAPGPTPGTGDAAGDRSAARDPAGQDFLVGPPRTSTAQAPLMSRRPCRRPEPAGHEQRSGPRRHRRVPGCGSGAPPPGSAWRRRRPDDVTPCPVRP